LDIKSFVDAGISAAPYGRTGRYGGVSVEKGLRLCRTPNKVWIRILTDRLIAGRGGVCANLNCSSSNAQNAAW
jgi:hypothetical protein